MHGIKSGTENKRRFASLVVGFLILGLTVWTSGCGNAESVVETSQAPAADLSELTGPRDVTAQTEAPRESAMSAMTSTPAPVVPEEAPVLGDLYPALTDGALRHARLIDLPTNLLLQAEGVRVTKAELDDEINQAPQHIRKELEDNAFLVLEQKATRDLLVALARQRVDDGASLDEERLLQRYFEGLTSSAKVSDTEIQAFYDQNREMVGDAPLEQLKPRISDHLRQEKQQQMVVSHIADLGKEMTIALSAAWIKEQAPRMLNNPVDRARGNGVPTFVNFGSKGCRPCEMMEPIRDKLTEELKGRVDVVYVNVQQQQILASRYGVRGIPHLVFFDKNGDIVHSHTGFMPEDQIREWMQKSGVPGK